MAQAKRVSKHHERLWIILAADGRHSTVGRDTDPSAEEIAGYEAKMAAQGIEGWLAIAEGDYFARRGRMTLMMVKPFGNPAAAFEEAVAAYEAIRTAR